MTGEVLIQIKGRSVTRAPYANTTDLRMAISRAKASGTGTTVITIRPNVTPEIEDRHFWKALDLRSQRPS